MVCPDSCWRMVPLAIQIPYVRLIWADELAALLESVQRECEEREAVLVREMAEAEGVNEEMKGNEQMAWVQRMEMICGRVEEVVCEESIG